MRWYYMIAGFVLGAGAILLALAAARGSLSAGMLEWSQVFIGLFGTAAIVAVTWTVHRETSARAHEFYDRARREENVRRWNVVGALLESIRIIRLDCETLIAAAKRFEAGKVTLGEFLKYTEMVKIPETVWGKQVESDLHLLGTEIASALWEMNTSLSVLDGAFLNSRGSSIPLDYEFVNMTAEAVRQKIDDLRPELERIQAGD